MLYFLYTTQKANLSRRIFLLLVEIFRNRYAAHCGTLCELLRLSPYPELPNALRASNGFLQAFTEVYASEANQQGKRNRFSRHKLAARVIPIPLLRFARTAFLIIRHRRQAMPLRCPIQL